MFTVGQLVKFSNPVDEHEQADLFAVVELRGERVLVQAIKGFEGWSLRPQMSYLVTDLQSA